jgi:hypothetical protein
VGEENGKNKTKTITNDERKGNTRTREPYTK